MNIAFYAPLKPVDHPVPSGDRRVARLLVRALTLAGHRVVPASRLRSWDREGDAARQWRLRALGAGLARRLIRRWQAAPPDRRPTLWFTYHLYHKAPDWLGPAVCRALTIPYIVAEASFAPKQADGPWRTGHAATAEALGRADLVFGLNPADRACIEPLLRPSVRYQPLPPFLDMAGHAGTGETAAADRAGLAREHGLAPADAWLLTVAMMRPGAKCRSYRLLAEALAPLRSRPGWRLLVAGDGPARPGVEAGFAPFGDRVRFLGRLDEAGLALLYRAADLFVWPAIREAYGMAMLEAQAAGLPVVAGGGGGVGAIVRDGETGLLTATGDGPGFGAAIARLLDDPARRRAMGRAAAAVARRDHDLAPAAAAIGAAIETLCRSWPAAAAR